MAWPWRRFEKCWHHFKIRQTIEEIRRRRDQTVAAYFSNSSFNESRDGLEKRLEIVEIVEKSAKSIIHALLTGEKLPEDKAADEAFERDPLFRTLRRRRWEMEQMAERGRAQSKAQMPNAGRAGEMMAIGAAMG